MLQPASAVLRYSSGINNVNLIRELIDLVEINFVTKIQSERLFLLPIMTE